MVKLTNREMYMHTGSSQCPCSEDKADDVIVDDDNFMLEMMEVLIVIAVTVVNDYITTNAAPIGPVPTVQHDIPEVIRFEGNIDDISESYSISSNESIIIDSDSDSYAQMSCECTDYFVIDSKKVVCGKVSSHNYTTVPKEELVCGSQTKEPACDTPSKLNHQPGEYSDHADHTLVVCVNPIKVKQPSTQEVNEPMPNMLTNSNDNPEEHDDAKTADGEPLNKPNCNAAMLYELTYLTAGVSATPAGMAVFNGVPLCSKRLLDGEFVCGIGDFKKKEI